MRSRRTGELNLGILLGCLLGATATLLVGAWVESEINSFKLIRDYQTLIGSVLAVAGAAVSVWMIRRQIDQSQLEHEDNLNRKWNASRAVLPLSLSNLTTYAKESVAVLLNIYEPDHSHPNELITPPGQLTTPPRLPDEVVLVLKNNIEFGNEASIIAITNLIGHLQIQHSRLSGVLESLQSGRLNTVIVRTNVEHFLVDALVSVRRVVES